MIGFLAGFGYLAISYGPSLLRESEVWHKGQSVPIQSLQGQCRTGISWLPLSNCHFSLVYEGLDGAARTNDVRAFLLGGLDRQEEPQLKIDPDHPDSIALSWLIEAITERWLVLVSLLFIGIALAAVICGMMLKILSEWRLYRAMGRKPQPIEVAILGMRHVSSPGYAREYSFTYQVNGAVRQEQQRLRVLKGLHGIPPEQWEYETPIILNRDTNTALALLGPKQRALLVPRSFSPFVLEESEKRKVLAFAENFR